MASDIVAGFFFDIKIGCESPYPSWFIDKLFLRYSVDKVFNVESLNQLMIDMRHVSTNLSDYSKTPKKTYNPETYDRCYTAEELIDIHQFSKVSMSKEDLQLISPALSYIRANNFCIMKSSKTVIVTNYQQKSEKKRLTGAESMRK
jgi:hypothetical protein